MSSSSSLPSSSSSPASSSSSPPATALKPTQRYAAGALFALALRQAQIHQTAFPLGLDPTEDGGVADAGGRSSGTSSSSDEGAADLWVHESHGLLHPVFRFLQIDPKAWPGLDETAMASEVKHHVGPYLRVILEEDSESSQENTDQELALTKAIEAMAISLEGQSSELHNSSGSPPSESHVTVEPEKSASELDGHLSEQRKMTVLCELLSACLAGTQVPQEEKKASKLRKGYDARLRVALRHLSAWFNVDWMKMEAIERIVACSAIAAAKEKEETRESESPKGKWDRLKQGGIIGVAALTGGALLAITGGLAAPAIAAGFGALAPTLGTLMPVIGASGFAAMASAAGSVAGSMAVAASFGAAGAGLSGSKMARRIADVKEFEFKHLGETYNQGRLAVGIYVSGFTFEVNDFWRPWEGIANNMERYILLWESEIIIAVSTAIQDWLTSKLTMELLKQGAMRTVLNSLLSAIALPATLLSATDFIDSKWSIAIDRSDKAGKLLAEVLRKGLQGYRPVTLVGFSLGARVIFKCLQELAEAPENEGLVERVVLLGAPVSVHGERWESARKMVAGRFVNVYSKNDWILGITFRASLLTQGLAGIQALDIPGVENVDVTKQIDRHSSYLWTAEQILQQLDIDGCYPVFFNAS